MNDKMPMQMIERLRHMALEYGYVLDYKESWYCFEDGRIELLFRKPK